MLAHERRVGGLRVDDCGYGWLGALDDALAFVLDGGGRGGEDDGGGGVCDGAPLPG